jgi:uncharacterized protein (DUF2147 family)
MTLILPRFHLAALAAAAVFASSPTAAAARADLSGIWVNPKGTVAVQTQACSGRLCGRIVWVSASALADAKESGVDNPVGIELLKDYRREGDGTWHGMVYVPDMGRSFHSTIVALAPDRLKISGCLLGNFICKSQIWRRR